MDLIFTTIHAQDFEKSLEFYTEIIGLPIISRFGTPDRPIAMLGKADSAHLEIIGDGKGPVDLPISIGFATDDAEATARSITDDYIGPIQPNPRVKFCFIRDPDGYTVQLVQYL